MTTTNDTEKQEFERWISEKLGFSKEGMELFNDILRSSPKDFVSEFSVDAIRDIWNTTCDLWLERRKLEEWTNELGSEVIRLDKANTTLTSDNENLKADVLVWKNTTDNRNEVIVSLREQLATLKALNERMKEAILVQWTRLNEHGTHFHCIFCHVEEFVGTTITHKPDCIVLAASEGGKK